MKRQLVILAVVCFATFLSIPVRAVAHCDTLDGPVVASARAALDKGDITPVLKWVRSDNEQEIRDVFGKASAARKSGPESKEISDRYFFETLVRLHRAGEGAPYTGLKPGPAEPIIAEADTALEQGSVDKLLKRVTDAVSDGIKKRFRETVERKRHAEGTVSAGREYVEAYVDFTHFVERLHNDAVGPVAAHGAAEEGTIKEGHGH